MTVVLATTAEVRGLSTTDAKKKRALHSRFNRKTSFIRSFIIIKEPGKLPTLVPRERKRRAKEKKKKRE